MISFKNDYDDEWIVDNYPGRCTKQFFKAYVDRTGFEGSQDTFRHHCMRALKLRSNTWKVWTKDMDEWLIEHYHSLGMVLATEKINNVFGLKLPVSNVQKRATKILGVYTDQAVAKLHLYNGKEIGHEGTIKEYCGYLNIKSGSSYKDWIPYHRYLYEQHYGKLPQNYNVIFLNNNTRDFRIDNLMAVPRNYVLMLAKNGFRSDDETITKAGVRWCDLYYGLKSR